MNNTKVIIKEIRRQFVVVQTIRDQRQILIPRIIFCFSSPCSGLTVDRRQFPLRLGYAMTVNKSQGHTLERVCMDLQENRFAVCQMVVLESKLTSLCSYVQSIVSHSQTTILLGSISQKDSLGKLGLRFSAGSQRKVGPSLINKPVYSEEVSLSPQGCSCSQGGVRATCDLKECSN